MEGLCKDCVRFHPRAKGNCTMARHGMHLERKWQRINWQMAVLSCDEYITASAVFPVSTPETSDYDEEKADLSPDDFSVE